MQERFNRYCPTKQITSKPSRSVYLAYPSNHASQKVILKVFKAASFSSEQYSHTFLQQAKRIRQLKHSSIVPILDLGVEQGQPYLVREYLASDSLRHRLDHLSPQGLGLQDVLKIIFQVGQVLRYAHQHQILHGHLKPENIFFNSSGEVLLADFGIASGMDITKRDDHSDQQTMSYLAPEQLAGPATEKSDQYALACLTYELLTGRVPFSTQSISPGASLLSDEDELTNADKKKENKDKDPSEQILADIFCENKQCSDYEKVGRDNIRKFGKTRKGVQRWQCKTCRTTWSFSSTETPFHNDLIPLSDLVPDLPESIEEVVLKAMAKDPSKRYADISIFLNALQITLLLPTSPFTSISPVTPLPTHIPNLVEKMPSEAPVAIDIREHWKHMQNDYYTSKALEIPDSDTHHTSKTLSTPNSDTYLSNKTLVTPNSDIYLSSKTLSTPNSDTFSSKALSTPNSDTYLPSKTLVETLPEGRHPQHSKPLPPTLWLAFALSGLALLLGTMILYALVPSHSPGSDKLVKSNPTIHPSMQVMSTPTVQPSVQITNIPTIQPPVPNTKTSVPNPTAASIQMAVEPSVSNNCHGPNWSKPPNNANNDYPSNAYYVVTLNGNASCYTANWVIPSGPTTAKTCDFTTLFTRNTNAEVVYTFVNQNGRKRSFDTNIDSSPYWMVFQSLRDITSIKLTAKDGQSPTTMSAGPFTLSNCH